jgi:hypothetical protein
MIRLLLLALLLSSPAHAETHCDGMLTSNNICIGSESNVPPVIVRCNYYDNSGNSDPRCVGVSDRHLIVERPRSKSTSPR